jgi:cytochrome c556
MKGMKKAAWVQAVGVVAVLTAGGVAAWAADDILKTRQADMKTMGEQLKAIKGIIDAGGNAADVVGPSNKIVEIAGLIPSLFPEGSDKGDTGANAEIWQKFDDFKAHAETLKTEASMLASAGQSGDLATVRAQFDKVAKACGDCHKPYRHKRQ